MYRVISVYMYALVVCVCVCVCVYACYINVDNARVC